MLTDDQTIGDEIRQMGRAELEAYAETITNLYNQQTRTFAQKIPVPIANDLNPNEMRILSQLAGMTLRGFRAVAKFDLATATGLEITDYQIMQRLYARGYVVDLGASVSLSQQISFVELPTFIYMP